MTSVALLPAAGSRHQGGDVVSQILRARSRDLANATYLSAL